MNKKAPLIVGVLVILTAVVIVLTQRSSSNTAPLPTTTVTPGTTYTLADVALHKTESDCWTAVNGSVYNVTSWIAQHPGGAQAIIGMCGVDGSAGFDGQHGTQKRPASELASFKIGALK